MKRAVFKLGNTIQVVSTYQAENGELTGFVVPINVAEWVSDTKEHWDFDLNPHPEHANILAHEYLSGTIPGDGQLLADLAGMLPLLAHLYGRVTTSLPGGFLLPSPANGGGRPARPGSAAGQGPLVDPEIRKEIELWAEERAIEHFTELGWTTIERVGSFRPYDLECKNEVGEILHVEVKGTQSRGEKVELTDGEVRHNRNVADCPADYHAFYEMARIKVSPEGEIARSDEEEVTCILPWRIDEEHDLAPIKYTYTVPTA